MQRFAHAKLVTLGLKDMLFITWNTIRVTEVSLDIALASDDGQYLRTLLRILLLALQVHIVPSRPESEANGLRFPNPTEKIIQTVIDILTHLVASGVRSLAGSIHEAPNSSQPADLALLTSLLQACVRIPGIELHHATICSRLAEANTARVAATLFSWSDQLLINSEPVYGDISIRYLVELSGIPLMAGEIAADGVLSQLSNARLMRYIRAGLEPLNPQHHMLYDIWSRGILPLCLNLLTAVGPGIASDVAAFLSTFNQHLLAASSFFAANSLALITVILDKFRAAGPTMGSKQAETLQWDKTQVRVDLTEWIENRSGLRAAVTSTSEAQLRLADEKGKGDGSRLEDMVVHELLDCLVLLE
jgi:nuclear pore complex protein Nup188